MMIGFFSIKVIKFACCGRISKGPCEFSEDIESALPCQIIFTGDDTVTVSILINVFQGLIVYLYTKVGFPVSYPIFRLLYFQCQR